MGTYYSNQLLAFTNMEDTARDEKGLFCEVHSQILSPNCLILNESIPTRSMTEKKNWWPKMLEVLIKRETNAAEMHITAGRCSHHQYDTSEVTRA